MKNIILTIVLATTLFGCSSDEDNYSQELTQKLISSWKIIGYTDDLIDPQTGTNYHVIENGAVIKFKEDRTFEHVLNNSEMYEGQFYVTKDSILKMNYTANVHGEPYTFITKIFILNETILEEGGDLYRTHYEKLVSN